MSDLELVFVLRDYPGRIRVHLEPNHDPEDTGHSLVATGYSPEKFVGFPVIEATVAYDGRGARAWMGWVQVVAREDDDGTVKKEVDLPPFQSDDSPFYTFGCRPTFSDFPANPTHPDGSWHAHAFLVTAPDVVRSRILDPVCGFSWGYRLSGGRPVELFRPTPASPSRWDGFRDLLSERSPSWVFHPAVGNSVWSLSRP